MDWESSTNYYLKWSRGDIQMLFIYLERQAYNTLLIATSGRKEPYFYFKEDVQLLFENKIMKSLKINNNILLAKMLNVHSCDC